MNLNFSLSNDPRAQILAQRDRNAYASQYIANMAMWFKLASTLASQNEITIVPQKVVEKLTADLRLSVSDCAKVLRVTRPTVYSWLKQKQAPQAIQMERLRDVSKVTQVISNYLQNKPELDLKATLPDGGSIVALLCADRLDAARIESAMRTLSNAPVRYLADISDDDLEEKGEVNHALLAYLKKAKM